MAAHKVNCWEEKRCGREPGGPRAAEFGACPAATDSTCDGINGGRNAGRLCWAVAADACSERPQGSFPDKMARCEACSFFRRVKYEEGCHFQLLKPGLGASDPAQLHRLLNSVVSLLAVSRDILALLAERPLLEEIVGHAREATGAASAAAYLFSESGDELALAAQAGPLERPERVGLRDECAVAAAARARRCVQAPAATPGRDATALAVPIGGRDRLAGVLELVKDGAPTTDDVWFIHELSFIAALGIANARLVDDLRQLKRFDKAKSRFVAVLMHHISSPLATIACSLQALAQLGAKLSDDARAKLIQVSLERIGSIQELSRRLLDLAAIRSGTTLGRIQPTPVAQALRAEVEARQARARERGVELVLADGAAEARVQADPDGLRVIFANLLDNALKYTTGPVRRVSASLALELGNVRAEIRDTGIGIPPEDQPRVFEEFHRAGNVAGARAPGHGLGLAIVRELVHRYAGRIELDSTVGVGTCITVVFPVVLPMPE